MLCSVLCTVQDSTVQYMTTAAAAALCDAQDGHTVLCTLLLCFSVRVRVRVWHQPSRFTWPLSGAQCVQSACRSAHPTPGCVCVCAGGCNDTDRRPGRGAHAGESDRRGVGGGSIATATNDGLLSMSPSPPRRCLQLATVIPIGQQRSSASPPALSLSGSHTLGQYMVLSSA